MRRHLLPSEVPIHIVRQGDSVLIYITKQKRELGQFKCIAFGLSDLFLKLQEFGVNYLVN